MIISRFFFISFLVFGLSACMVSRQANQLTHDAEKAFLAGDYASALTKYNELVELKSSRNRKVDGVVYLNAGLSAWEFENIAKAIEYLEKAKAKQVNKAKLYYALSKAYLQIDNLSREITNLELFVQHFPEDEKIDEINNQLFIAYVESRNWPLAENLWTKVSSEFKNDTKTLTAYLTFLNEKGQNQEAIEVAKKLLKVEANSTFALEALAQSYYSMAEDSYQKEMRAYEQNRTTRQYRHLLNELETINANFRTSRDYFEKLYALDPSPRYATFLGNIYTRFDNKQRADYYYRKAKGE